MSSGATLKVLEAIVARDNRAVLTSTGGVISKISPGEASRVAVAMMRALRHYRLPPWFFASSVRCESLFDPEAINPNGVEYVNMPPLLTTDWGLGQASGVNLNALGYTTARKAMDFIFDPHNAAMLAAETLRANVDLARKLFAAPADYLWLASFAYNRGKGALRRLALDAIEAPVRAKGRRHADRVMKISEGYRVELKDA